MYSEEQSKRDIVMGKLLFFFDGLISFRNSSRGSVKKPIGIPNN